METKKQTRNAVDPINFLRVVALMMVFMLHSIISTNDPNLMKCGHGFAFLFKTPAWAGVWIFIILSGYLIGKVFFQGRYTLDKAGLKKYYLSRLIRIVPPYLFLCFFIGIFVFPDFFFKNPMELLHLLTFTFNGTTAVVGIGATWYVSTVMQLYFLAPFIFFFLKKIQNNQKAKLFLFIVITFIGLGLRLLLFTQNIDWYTYIYSFSLLNLDLFVGGMLLGGLNNYRNVNQKVFKFRDFYKVISYVLLFGLILFNNYLYTYGELKLFDVYIFIYRYILPTVYLLVVAFFLLVNDYEHSHINEQLSFHAIKRNPFRLIDGLSTVSFEFYLWHSNVLFAIFPYLPMIKNASPLVNHFVKMSLGGLVTLMVAIVMYVLLEKPVLQWRANRLKL